MLQHPPVSCLCLTYARPALLEEAIYSFLRQDYPGQKELIVLNDYGRQHLEFDHPEVRVFNLPKRLRTVGEKMNMAAALASHDLLFVWDDDDIYLPHRLALSVARLEPKQGFFKPDKAWVWDGGTLSGPATNLFHAGSCWTRALFTAAGGYGAEGTGYDLDFERHLERACPGATTPYEIGPQDIYYLYRWGGTGSYHMSGFGQYGQGENVGHQDVEAYVQRGAAAGTIPQGRITLAPRWQGDYPGLVAAYLRASARTARPPDRTDVQDATPDARPGGSS